MATFNGTQVADTISGTNDDDVKRWFNRYQDILF